MNRQKPIHNLVNNSKQKVAQEITPKDIYLKSQRDLQNFQV